MESEPLIHTGLRLEAETIAKLDELIPRCSILSSLAGDRPAWNRSRVARKALSYGLVFVEAEVSEVARGTILAAIRKMVELGELTDADEAELRDLEPQIAAGMDEELAGRVLRILGRIAATRGPKEAQQR